MDSCHAINQIKRSCLCGPIPLFVITTTAFICVIVIIRATKSQ